MNSKTVHWFIRVILVIILFSCFMAMLQSCSKDEEPQPVYPIRANEYDFVVWNLTGSCHLQVRKAESIYWNVDLPSCEKIKITDTTKNMLCVARGSSQPEFCK